MKELSTIVKALRQVISSVFVCVLLTQWDLLPRVSRQKEDKQSQSGDQDTRDEQVEAVVEGPSPHHHGEGDVRIRLLAAVVKTLVRLSWNLCVTRQNTIHSSRKLVKRYGEVIISLTWGDNSNLRCTFEYQSFSILKATGPLLPTRSHSPLAM